MHATWPIHLILDLITLTMEWKSVSDKALHYVICSMYLSLHMKETQFLNFQSLDKKELNMRHIRNLRFTAIFHLPPL
jgi:hypothetical protein